jgi:hypothetical protein
LDAGVEHAGFGIAGDFDFEFELEVGVGFPGGDEVVFFYLLGGGTAGDEAVFDAPHGGVEVPAGEGFAIEKGNGLGEAERG